MTRSYAYIPCSIWRDQAVCALTSSAQGLYLALRAQPDLNMAGILPMRQSLWASRTSDGTVDDINRDLDEMMSAGVILTDFCTQELGITRFLTPARWGANRNWLIAAARGLLAVESMALVRGLLEAAGERTRADLAKAFNEIRDAIPDEFADAIGDAIPINLNPNPNLNLNLSPQKPSVTKDSPPTGLDNEERRRRESSSSSEERRITETLNVLARRILEGAKAREHIKNEQAYYSKCLETCGLRHRAALGTLAEQHPDWTPRQLADAIDAPTRRGPPEYIPDRFRDFEAEDRERDGWWSP